MKSILLALTVFLGLCLSYGNEAVADTASPGGKLVDVHSQSLFVPVGFDDNDETLVVLDGYLPDPCYKIAPAAVTRDLEHNQIIVEQKARLFTGTCNDMTVPFTTVVHVGVLPQGNFTVVTNHGQTTQMLPVKKASSSSPDDYLYAPIDSVQVEEREPGNFVAILNGRFTSTCASMGNVILTDHEATIEVMPVMQIKTGAESEMCGPLVFGFKKEIQLPQVNPGSHLLHVRSLDGQSVNGVFRYQPTSENQ